nr:MAG TPA: hypothetical protein [Caudoviricetes sp.]
MERATPHSRHNSVMLPVKSGFANNSASFLCLLVRFNSFDFVAIPPPLYKFNLTISFLRISSSRARLVLPCGCPKILAMRFCKACFSSRGY